MTTTTVRWALTVAAVGAGAGVMTDVAAAAEAPPRECFGGAPTAVVTGEHGPTAVTVVGDSLVWLSVDGQRRMSLGKQTKTTAPIPGDLDIKAMDTRLAVGATNINNLEAVDLPSGKRRVLVEGHETMEEPLLFSTLALDDRYLYFGRGENQPPFTRSPRIGFHRVRRSGGAPEFLGPAPDGQTTFTVAEGYVYWRDFHRQDGSERRVAELVRRRLQRDAAVQIIAPLRSAGKEPLVVQGGRIYYVDGDEISSVPVGGGAPPTVHAGIGQVGVVDLLADEACVYWVNTAGAIQRAQGPRGAVERIGTIPDMKPSLRNDPVRALASDGARLYWADAKSGSILAVGRARDVTATETRTTVAKSAVTSAPRPATSDRLLVGSGWGCARRGYRGAREMQCWQVPGTPNAKAPAIRARPVPWLAADHYAATADRLCALTAKDARCWTPAELFGTAPADVAFAPMSFGTLWDQELAAGGGATCTEKDNVWTCSGDDSFGLLGKGAAGGTHNRLFGGYIALSAFHGCVAGESVLCWGRNDAMQLGFPTTETCQIDGHDIPCSHEAKTPAFKLPRAPGIHVADTFTCTQRGDFHCWGASRDGLFGTAEACPPTMRTAFPTRSGPVAAPNATCSATPVEMPAFPAGQAAHPAAFGPRGVCGIAGNRVKCAGAIPTPTDVVVEAFGGGPFSALAVSRGDDASACAASKGGVVCWGAGYSPSATPERPVPIAFTDVVVDGPSVDTTAEAPKGKWPPGCNINEGCAARLAPPPCPAGVAAGATAWPALLAKLAAGVGAPTGQVTVRGPLLVQAGDDASPLVEGRCAPAEPKPIVLGRDTNPLLIDGLTCHGDGSRRCCDACAFGQDVVARGHLAASGARWILRNPQLCTAR